MSCYFFHSPQNILIMCYFTVCVAFCIKMNFQNCISIGSSVPVVYSYRAIFTVCLGIFIWNLYCVFYLFCPAAVFIKKQGQPTGQPTGPSPRPSQPAQQRTRAAQQPRPSQPPAPQQARSQSRRSATPDPHRPSPQPLTAVPAPHPLPPVRRTRV